MPLCLDAHARPSCASPARRQSLHIAGRALRCSAGRSASTSHPWRQCREDCADAGRGRGTDTPGAIDGVWHHPPFGSSPATPPSRRGRRLTVADVDDERWSNAPRPSRRPSRDAESSTPVHSRTASDVRDKVYRVEVEASDGSAALWILATHLRERARHPNPARSGRGGQARTVRRGPPRVAVEGIGNALRWTWATVTGRELRSAHARREGGVGNTPPLSRHRRTLFQGIGWSSQPGGAADADFGAVPVAVSSSEDERWQRSVSARESCASPSTSSRPSATPEHRCLQQRRCTALSLSSKGATASLDLQAASG